VSVASVTDPGGTVSLTGWPIVLPGQKEVAPLTDSSFYGAGGVPLTAFITWWGYPLTNPNAWCFTTIPFEVTVYQGSPPPSDAAGLTAFLATCD
jgi:hypothetical protein